MKTCKGCGITKRLDCFHRNATKSDGLHNRCKTCVNFRDKQYYAANRDKILAQRLLRLYGLTPEARDTILATQNGRCAICKAVLRGECHIDHCHASGAVRGLLCTACNKGLGFFRDNPESLIAAAGYLKAKA